MNREKIQQTLNVIYGQVFNEGRTDLYPNLAAGPQPVPAEAKNPNTMF